MKKIRATPDRRKNCKLPHAIKLKGIDEQEKLFILLHAILGYNASDAYLIAYPESNASRISATSMASKLLRDSRIQMNIEYLHSYWLSPGYVFNESARKTLSANY